MIWSCYNAQTHRFYELYTKANGALEEGEVEENLWSPLVAGRHSFWAVGLMQRFAAVVYAAQADGLSSVPLTTVTYAGRSAWQMEVTRAGQQVKAVVDKASGVLLYGSWTTLAGGADRQLEEVSLSNLHFGSQLPAATFVPPVSVATMQPADDHIPLHDHGRGGHPRRLPRSAAALAAVRLQPRGGSDDTGDKGRPAGLDTGRHHGRPLRRSCQAA